MGPALLPAPRSPRRCEPCGPLDERWLPVPALAGRSGRGDPRSEPPARPRNGVSSASRCWCIGPAGASVSVLAGLAFGQAYRRSRSGGSGRAGNRRPLHHLCSFDESRVQRLWRGVRSRQVVGSGANAFASHLAVPMIVSVRPSACGSPCRSRAGFPSHRSCRSNRRLRASRCICGSPGLLLRAREACFPILLRASLPTSIRLHFPFAYQGFRPWKRGPVWPSRCPDAAPAARVVQAESTRLIHTRRHCRGQLGKAPSGLGICLRGFAVSRGLAGRAAAAAGR